MKRWVLIASSIVIVLAAAYGLFAWLAGSKTAQQEAVLPPRIPEVVIESDSYEDSIRTVEGTVAAETPCQTLEATGLHSPSGGVRIDLVLPPDDGICLERPEDRPFSVEIEADEDAPLTVFVNGMQAPVGETHD